MEPANAQKLFEEWERKYPKKWIHLMVNR
jgi:hypothetical protein